MNFCKNRSLAIRIRALRIDQLVEERQNSSSRLEERLIISMNVYRLDDQGQLFSCF